MLRQNSFDQRQNFPVLFYAGAPVLVTAFMWATSSNELSFPQFLAAFALGLMPWASYQQWRRGNREELPLFSLISVMYWLGYAVPLFWSAPSINLVSGSHRLSQPALTKSLELVVAGVFALWAGMKFASHWRWLPSVLVDVPENPWRWHYLRMVLLGSAFMKAVVPYSAWGGGGRQVLVNIEVVIPSVTFSILLRYYLRGRGLDVDKVLLGGYFLLALVLGVSSGWMASVVSLGVICLGTYALERRKFPVAAILLILPVVLFLQPGKAKFRERYWQRGPVETYSDYGERIGFWIDTSARLWANAITDPTGTGLTTVTDSFLSRVSLLQQTANVVEMTPAQVPYQHGRLYSYVVVTWIPRLVWPGKPSMNDANQWYQLVYQISSPRQLEGVSIAVGTLTESYINFGWFGPLFVMPCLGFFLGAFQRIFFNVGSGLLLTSIGVALLPGLLVLEAQMAQYVSGIAQQVLVAMIVAAPIAQLARRKTSRRLPERRAAQRYQGNEEATVR